jgi:4'-phosphopantetheinyl transferase EntD
MEAVGVTHADLRRAPSREPLWPAGIRGSLTHCEGLRIALVVPDDRGISVGVDAELHRPLPPEVAEAVLTGEEAILASDFSTGVHWQTVVFCAKEAAFKAWFAATGDRVGFEEVAVELERDRFAVHAIPSRSDQGLRSSRDPEVRGRWGLLDGFAITVAWTRSQLAAAARTASS